MANCNVCFFINSVFYIYFLCIYFVVYIVFINVNLGFKTVFEPVPNFHKSWKRFKHLIKWTENKTTYEIFSVTSHGWWSLFFEG